ncbi:hypothetical protein C8Q77DRAFT_221763 [Trametes polyzona]|nr:hypothetical protein C8Q77DRAFT_221763 [Trametes polyzona]
MMPVPTEPSATKTHLNDIYQALNEQRHHKGLNFNLLLHKVADLIARDTREVLRRARLREGESEVVKTSPGTLRSPDPPGPLFVVPDLSSNVDWAAVAAWAQHHTVSRDYVMEPTTSPCPEGRGNQEGSNSPETSSSPILGLWYGNEGSTSPYESTTTTSANPFSPTSSATTATPLAPYQPMQDAVQNALPQNATAFLRHPLPTSRRHLQDHDHSHHAPSVLPTQAGFTYAHPPGLDLEDDFQLFQRFFGTPVALREDALRFFSAAFGSRLCRADFTEISPPEGCAHVTAQLPQPDATTTDPQVAPVSGDKPRVSLHRFARTHRQTPPTPHGGVHPTEAANGAPPVRDRRLMRIKPRVSSTPASADVTPTLDLIKRRNDRPEQDIPSARRHHPRSSPYPVRPPARHKGATMRPIRDELSSGPPPTQPESSCGPGENTRSSGRSRAMDGRDIDLHSVEQGVDPNHYASSPSGRYRGRLCDRMSTTSNCTPVCGSGPDAAAAAIPSSWQPSTFISGELNIGKSSQPVASALISSSSPGFSDFVSAQAWRHPRALRFTESPTSLHTSSLPVQSHCDDLAGEGRRASSIGQPSRPRATGGGSDTQEASNVCSGTTSAPMDRPMPEWHSGSWNPCSSLSPHPVDTSPRNGLVAPASRTLDVSPGQRVPHANQSMYSTLDGALTFR